MVACAYTCMRAGCSAPLARAIIAHVRVHGHARTERAVASLSRAGILAVAACLCATEADAFFSGVSFGRLAPAVRAEKSTHPGKSAVTMQFAFKMPQFTAPQFPTAGGGAAVKTVAVSGEASTAERISPACRQLCPVARGAHLPS